MTLQRVTPYLDNAFEFLDHYSFDVDKNNWNSFWRHISVSNEDLRAAKKELLQRRVNSLKNSDEYEHLTRHIYCCNPFDKKSETDLKSCWERRCESQHDLYCSYYQRITATIKKRKRKYVRRLGHNLWIARIAIEQDLPWLAYVLRFSYEFISSRLHNIHILYKGYKSSSNPLIIGMITTAVTVSLVILIASPILERSNSARYVASFIAGLFGYTAIETLRRSLD